MKQLRILTGRHAGARINLTATRHQIGADEAADIQLLDWTAEPVVIGAGEDGMVHIATASQGGQASAVLADFTPRRFGDVVLCMGAGSIGAVPAKVVEMLRTDVPAMQEDR